MRPIDMTMTCAIGSGGRLPGAVRSLPQVRSASVDQSQSACTARRPAFDDAARGVALFENAAVLFADIIGFTGLAEGLPPAKALDFLRRYHARMAETVFMHGGTVLQYSGDSIMATFGAPLPGPHNATDALSCGYDMLAAISLWNAKRRLRGRFPVDIGIGIHIGTVAIGEIGVERHLEQSIAGDTVNVARKLEAMTRKTGAPLIVSSELVDAVTRECHNTRILAPLTAKRRRKIPGRLNGIPIWVLERAAATHANAAGWCNGPPRS